jgi:leader peptidase (prepilin peptidase)/N-methyltransferase
MVTPEILLPFFALAFGLAVGSFGNVLIHRLPRRESIVSPGSHCPACGDAIPWFLNVPVLSWAVLLGRCRKCRAPISVRYPAVEAVCGLLFTAAAVRWGFSIATPAACAFCAMVLFLAVIDLEHQLLPDALTWPGIALGLAFCAFVPWTTWRSSLLGAALGGLLPMAVLLFW